MSTLNQVLSVWFQSIKCKDIHCSALVCFALCNKARFSVCVCLFLVRESAVCGSMFFQLLFQACVGWLQRSPLSHCHSLNIPEWGFTFHLTVTSPGLRVTVSWPDLSGKETRGRNLGESLVSRGIGVKKKCAERKNGIGFWEEKGYSWQKSPSSLVHSRSTDSKLE